MKSLLPVVLLCIACGAALCLEGITPLSASLLTQSQVQPEAACDQTAGKDGSVAICVIARNQHEDLIEWVEHHLKLGVSKIYLFDHGSDPPLNNVLGPYALFGPVVYHWSPDHLLWRFLGNTTPWPRHRRMNVQDFAYQYCIQAYRHRHQWIAFIDIDEFVLLKNRTVKDLPTFMKAYEEYGGLAVNWMNFGTSGHKVRPNGTVLANYWKCFPDMRVKTVANTNYVVNVSSNPHAFVYQPGYFAVNEQYKPVPFAFCKNCSRSGIVLNHYVIKSEAEFMAKVQRGGGTGGGNGRRPEYLQEADRKANHNCTDAVSLMEGRTWNPPVGLASLQPIR